MHHPQLEELTEKDPRYSYEAYEFVFEALEHTQRMLGRAPGEERETEDPDEETEERPTAGSHVSGRELCEGIRDLALKQFGGMARVVFRLWGINQTRDFGHIVFNLIDAKLMSKTDQDSLQDFTDIYNLDEALVQTIVMDEVE